MKLSLGAATFVATTLLMGGGVAYSLVADEPTGDDVVVTEPTADEPETEEPEAEEPETEEPEVEEPEVEEPEVEEPEAESDEREAEKPGGPEAAAEHREAMATWKDCVDAAVEDALAECGTKPAPPGKALGWDGEKVSKNAQKKVEKADRAEKVKTNKGKGKGHQR